MTITYLIPFSLNLDDERERESVCVCENKIQHITLGFKTFCGIQFSNHLAATSNITTK